MKRRVGLILLLLVAGAIVNVAVAWGLALLVNLSAWQPDYRVTSREAPFLMQSRGWVHAHGYQLLSICTRIPEEGTDYPANDPTPNWSPHERQPSEWMMQSGSHRLEIAFVEARGWPMLALTSWCRSRHSAGAGKTEEQLHGLHVSVWPRKSVNGGHRRRMVPTHPLWPGFAINTLFYAGILWLMFAAPSALRRRRRIKRGLCPACAYPVGESEVCTECGLSLPSPSR